MKKIIPMTYDVMFTEIFNNEKNISLLEEFIAFYMDIPLKEVKGNLKLLKRNLDKNNLKSSKKEVDLLLELNGKKYNIELNNKWNQNIKNRNVVYISHIHGEQLKRGFKDYNDIEESIQINLNNSRSNEGIISRYYFRNEKGEILSEKCRIDVINLVNGKNMSYTNDEKENYLIDWCKVFTSKTEEELEKSSKKVLSKKRASKIVDEVIRLSGDDEVMIEFDMNSKRDLELKSEYDEMVSMFKEKEEKLKEQLKKREENLNKQLKEQLDKQLKEQLDKQLKEQLKHQEIILKEKEHNNQIEIAKNLLKLNLTTDNISLATGLTKEEINKLKE